MKRLRWILGLMEACAVLTFAAEKPAIAPPKNAVPAPAIVFNFDRDAPGKPPANFTLVPPVPEAPPWIVMKENQSPSKPNILMHRQRAAADDVVDLALVNGVSLEHGEAAVRFKALSGDENQSAGITFHYTDSQTSMIVWANVRDDSCSIQRVKKGKRKALDEKQVIITPYMWHELRVVFVNKTYTVFVDGDPTMGGKDPSLQGQGEVGIAADPAAVIQFDDFRVTP